MLIFIGPDVAVNVTHATEETVQKLSLQIVLKIDETVL